MAFGLHAAFEEMLLRADSAVPGHARKGSGDPAVHSSYLGDCRMEGVECTAVVDSVRIEVEERWECIENLVANVTYLSTCME